MVLCVKSGTRIGWKSMGMSCMISANKGRTREWVLYQSWNSVPNPDSCRILDRLAEIGWREEAEIISKQSHYGWDEFTTHKLVKQTKKLTEYGNTLALFPIQTPDVVFAQGWNSIKSELVTFLSAHKIERLAAERRRTLHERYSQLTNEISDIRSKTDLREPFPATGDISTYKIFEDLIWDTPEDQNLTGAFFREKLLEHLPSIIEEWRPAKIQELIEIMRKSVPTAGEAELHLATSVFTCKNCYAANMHYPQMFYHSCCNRSPPDHVSAERKPYIIFGRGSWKSQHLTLSDHGSRVVKTLVEACSLDPATTTIQDMHSANPLIECTNCFNSQSMNYYDPGRAFMRWSYAVRTTSRIQRSLSHSAIRLPTCHHTEITNSE